MNKKNLSERDICTKFITPALEEAGWDIQKQVKEEVSFTSGRIIVRGKMAARGKSKRADYILSYKPNLRIAIVEAKDNNHSVDSGLTQAIEYGQMLDVPFVYSSNGDGFIEHDRTATEQGTVTRELALDEFPSPQSLWERYCKWKGLSPDEQQLITQPYYTDAQGKMPRYYQMIAINRTIEAIAKGQTRLLLVMATGTGKTYTAFQIIWRLWKAKKMTRILFLADRNILVDQTMVNDFKPFKTAMAKLSSKSKTIEKESGETEEIVTAIKKGKAVDTSYEIYLGLYQSLTGPLEKDKVYKEFSPGFFDLIVIDECHRGSAREDSAWREILEYFTDSVQIGLTATPKETEEVSNIHYFGEPVYQYSLKDGIDDGFLAPYKVVRIGLDKDLEGWRPEAGKKDKHGNEIPDREYNSKDFDRELVLEKRTTVVAQLITRYLKETNQFDKTIVFCEDIDHAERMRQALVNENPELYQSSDKYIVRITGDNAQGKAMLDEFIDPESTYPVIATTSKLMSTGVDAQTCKLIVLDQNINSMTEFKQIIGRGTRINEEHGKTWFTIIDFRRATALFADSDFDGDPVQIYEPKPDGPLPPPEPDDEEGEEIDTEDTITNTDEEEGPEGIIDEEPLGDPDGPTGGGRQKYYVKDVEVKVIGEHVQYYGADGKLITESLKDYTKKCVQESYRTLNEFIHKWSESEKKSAIIKELEEKGVLLAALEEEAGTELDAFDLVCHFAFDQKPLTRKERADKAKNDGFINQYGEIARKVILALLDKYADEGISNIEEINVLKLKPLSDMGTPIELAKAFGGPDAYKKAIRDLEQHLYKIS